MVRTVFKDKLPARTSYPVGLSDFSGCTVSVDVYFIHSATWVRQAMPTTDTGAVPLARFQLSRPGLRVRNEAVASVEDPNAVPVMIYSVPSERRDVCRAALGPNLGRFVGTERLLVLDADGQLVERDLPNWC